MQTYMKGVWNLGLFLLVAASGCGGGDSSPAQDNTEGIAAEDSVEDQGATQEGGGHITYTLTDDGHIYLVEAMEGAVPRDLSKELDEISPGADDWVNLSPDGEWLLLSTERFGCEGWACLVAMHADLSLPVVVESPGAGIQHSDFAAIASSGAFVVFSMNDGSREDLYRVERNGEGWGEPTVLSEDSPYLYNNYPAVTDDGERVVFSCGPTPYSQGGTGICVVNSDGTQYARLVAPTDGPGATEEHFARSGDFAPDSSVVFEADWNGEQIWRVGATGAALAVVNDEYNNDNAPCVLPDGRIVSLWLQRPGSDGGHELKVMNSDGSSPVMLVIDVDVADIGLGCGK